MHYACTKFIYFICMIGESLVIVVILTVFAESSTLFLCVCVCVFFSVQLFMEFKLTKHLPLTQCTFYEIIGSNTTHVCARPSITREYFKLCSKEILASCTFPHEFHIFGVGQCN